MPRDRPRKQEKNQICDFEGHYCHLVDDQHRIPYWQQQNETNNCQYTSQLWKLQGPSRLRADSF